MPFPSIRPLRLATSSLLLLLCALAHAQPAPPPAAANTPATRPAGSAAVDGTAPTPSGATAAAPTAADAALLSRDARRIYELSRDKLVQIRTLLRNANTQASIGSGFFVSADGLIVTNFHVASQLALEPERYRGVYVTMEGQEGEVELYEGCLSFPGHNGAIKRPQKVTVRAFDRDGKPFTLKKGAALARRVALLIHNGDAKEGRVAERYEQYISGKLSPLPRPSQP